MTVTVSLKQRKKVSQPRIKIRWSEVAVLVKENYKAPNTHVLKECADKLKIADNEHSNQCVVSWVFNLERKSTPKKKITKKNVTSEKTLKKTTSKN